jgi:hypothetical protein
MRRWCQSVENHVPASGHAALDDALLRADAFACAAGQFAILLAGSITLRAGTIVDGAGPILSRTATQTMRAVGAGAKVNVALLTPTAGDIVTNTNAALGCGTGPVVSNGTLWKHLYTGATT